MRYIEDNIAAKRRYGQRKHVSQRIDITKRFKIRSKLKLSIVNSLIKNLSNVVLKKYHAKSVRPHILCFFKAFEAERWFAGGQTASEPHENHHPASNALKKYSR